MYVIVVFDPVGLLIYCPFNTKEEAQQYIKSNYPRNYPYDVEIRPLFSV